MQEPGSRQHLMTWKNTQTHRCHADLDDEVSCWDSHFSLSGTLYLCGPSIASSTFQLVQTCLRLCDPSHSLISFLLSIPLFWAFWYRHINQKHCKALRLTCIHYWHTLKYVHMETSAHCVLNPYPFYSHGQVHTLNCHPLSVFILSGVIIMTSELCLCVCVHMCSKLLS